MMVEYLIMPDGESISEFENLREMHVLRGRFLHLMTILERIMKEYCGEENSSKHKTYGELKNLFIKKLTDNNAKLTDKTDFYEFVRALHAVNPDRNMWAHGFIFYEKRFDEKANPYIYLNSKESFKDNYFDDLNSAFATIISWLRKNNLWCLRGYHILTEVR